MTMTPGKLWGMRRLADDGGFFRMTALDQRPPIMNPIREKRRTPEAPDQDVAAVKRVIAQNLALGSSALLVDPIWAYGACIDVIPPSRGVVITLEDHRFEDTPGGRRSANIPDWSVEKIRRIGGDAVKVLAWYRPDAAPDIIEHQKAYVRAIGEDCRRYDIPFVFELLVYPFANAASDYEEDQKKHPELVIESVRTFAAPEYGVDIFKLESPIPARSVPEFGGTGSSEVQVLFDELNEAAGRPWVMLSAGASPADFKRVLHHAFKAGASGFLAGRAIWLEAFRHFPDLAAMGAELAARGTAYLDDLQALTAAAATPFHEIIDSKAVMRHTGFDLPQVYGGMK
ncbi:MAG: tagatose 1,6-diphosphate aldolase [Geminicoccaceae bacterium]|nr:tagatose 1,6-diphosphate aldolase [Geminicoccaceae bacterium]MCB9944109.1 tagatose 1,6-diphosphate aldolase [Geminicoccaceae bacterium]